ncbi:MAG: glycine cleavage T C-terminal barrel domain-containing protein [Halobacteriales archaeon]|nr:glycine cleavage T C-terminal barrel domain-containing protein [Halobacteriales archaeon]
MSYEDALEAVAWARLDAGVVRVTGEDAHDYLDRTVTNDVRADETTRALLLDPDGKTEDSLRILPQDEGDGFLVVSRRPEETASKWREGIFVEDVTVELTDTTVVTVQGPNAETVVGDIDAPSYEARRTPAGGYDVLLHSEPDDVPGTRFDEHADALRVEAGVPSFENELEGRVPVGAGLEVFSEDKCYVGQEVVARIQQRGGGPSRVLRGFELGDEASEGDAILDDGRAVGEITSVAVSQRFGRIALGYADKSDEPTVRDERVKERALPFDSGGGT